MAIRRGESLWAAFTGKQPPQTVRELVGLIGGTKEAASAAGVSPRTVRRWVQRERDETPTTVSDSVKELGEKKAAKAAGVTSRTIRKWQQKEARGESIGKRQKNKMEKVINAANEQKSKDLRKNPNVQNLRTATLASPKARQSATSPRKMRSISKSGANISMVAKVVIDTGKRPDERWRNIQLNLNGTGLSEPTQEWLNGGSDEQVLGKLSTTFGRDYAPGTDWKFTEIRSMDFGPKGGAGGTFPM